MIIAVPIEEKEAKSEICQSFGRTPFYLIYDSENDRSMYLNNKAAKAEGGAGIKAAQQLVDENVDVVITPRCGKNAADILKAANIKLFKTKDQVAYENVDSFFANKLEVLDKIHAGFHNHGEKR